MSVRSRIPRAMGLLAALIASAALVLVAAPAQAQTPVITTDNWSGYVHRWPININEKPAYQDTFVSAQWQVPHNLCFRNVIDDDSIWVGLGGNWPNLVSDNTPLVQIGTWTECDTGAQLNWGIWEVVGPGNGGTGGAQLISKSSYCALHLLCPVYAGDLMTAQVENAGNGQYNMYLYDETRSWSFSTSYKVSVKSAQRPAATAEWIVEQPTSENLPLSDFGAVAIDHAYWEQSGYRYALTPNNGSNALQEEHTSVSGLVGGGGNSSDFVVNYNNAT